MARLTPFLLVGLGGFIGCNLRYLVGLYVVERFVSRIPLATFLINVTGSFLLGLVGTLVAERLVAWPEHFRLLLGIGFLGGFTTFSSYALETDLLLRQGETLRAALYFTLSPLCALLGARLGVIVALSLR